MWPKPHNTSLISGCVLEIGQWHEIPGQKQPNPGHGTPSTNSGTVPAIPGRLGTLDRRLEETCKDSHRIETTPAITASSLFRRL